MAKNDQEWSLQMSKWRKTPKNTKNACFWWKVEYLLPKSRIMDSRNPWNPGFPKTAKTQKPEISKYYKSGVPKCHICHFLRWFESRLDLKPPKIPIKPSQKVVKSGVLTPFWGTFILGLEVAKTQFWSKSGQKVVKSSLLDHFLDPHSGPLFWAPSSKTISEPL